MVKIKNNGSLIIISGPSGAGKGTICANLLKNNSNIRCSISMTTRLPRKNEIDGIDYYFVDQKKFEEEINNDNFLEYAKVHSNYYGTPKDKVYELLSSGYDVILEIDIQGALEIKEKYTNGIFIFIMPPSMKELKERLVKRNTESLDVIIERFKNAYKEINEVTKYNYVVVNDDVELATKKVESIIIAEKCRVDRIEEFDLNNQEEILHELLVDFNK